MSKDSKDLVPASGEFLVYVGDDGAAWVHVRLAEGTVWLTQKLMADLYGVSVPTVNEHLKNIYDEAELDPGATIRKFRIVRRRKSRGFRLLDHYSAGDHRGRLSGPLHAGHPLPAVGHYPARRVPGQGLRARRRAPEVDRAPRRGLLRTAPRAHPRHPRLGASLLPEDHRYLRAVQHRLRCALGDRADLLRDRAEPLFRPRGDGSKAASPPRISTVPSRRPSSSKQPG